VHAKVEGLVYIAAVVPDVGESTRDSLNGFAKAAYGRSTQAVPPGFAYLPSEAFVEHFAHDLPRTESRVLAATQAPIRTLALNEKLTAAAWRSKPVFYVLTEKDRMIVPEAQRDFVRRIQAKVLTIAAGHVPFLSRPGETAERVTEAVKSIAPRSRRAPRR
jgi:pimeloyl-ACP methyl ester carboxylesterase